MLKYLKNVATLRLDIEACNGCGTCAIVCPHGVLEIEDHKAVIADLDSCIECGACAINCPVNAVHVRTGVGCATGILLGAIGIQNECSCSCGASPAIAESTQSCCCDNDQTEDKKADGGTSHCC